MRATTLSDLRKGDYFHLRDDENSPLYVRGHYVRSEKKYCVHYYHDRCRERFLKGSTKVLAL